MGPMTNHFWLKVTHLGGTSPYALTCEYPPPPCSVTSVLRNLPCSQVVTHVMCCIISTNSVRGTHIIFLRGVRPKVWNPYQLSRDFSPLKTSVFFFFFFFFVNRDSFLRVSLPQKFYKVFFFFFFFFFFVIFVKWGPLWPKWDTCLRIFGEKVTHLGGTSLYNLTDKSPPPYSVTQQSFFTIYEVIQYEMK